jgi:hypothetical protein
VLQEFEKFAPAKSGVRLTAARSGPRSERVTDVLHFRLGGGEVMVGLVPAPVPKGEADEHAQFSFAGVRNGWKLPPHRAHLIVFLREPGSVPPIQGVMKRGKANETPRTLQYAGPLMSDVMSVPGPGIEPGTRGSSVLAREWPRPRNSSGRRGRGGGGGTDL